MKFHVKLEIRADSSASCAKTRESCDRFSISHPKNLFQFEIDEYQNTHNNEMKFFPEICWNNGIQPYKLLVQA